MRSGCDVSLTGMRCGSWVVCRAFVPGCENARARGFPQARASIDMSNEEDTDYMMVVVSRKLSMAAYGEDFE